jgi:hypothetical protein
MKQCVSLLSKISKKEDVDRVFYRLKSIFPKDMALLSEKDVCFLGKVVSIVDEYYTALYEDQARRSHLITLVVGLFPANFNTVGRYTFHNTLMTFPTEVVDALVKKNSWHEEANVIRYFSHAKRFGKNVNEDVMKNAFDTKDATPDGDVDDNLFFEELSKKFRNAKEGAEYLKFKNDLSEVNGKAVGDLDKIIEKIEKKSQKIKDDQINLQKEESKLGYLIVNDEEIVEILDQLDSGEDLFDPASKSRQPSSEAPDFKDPSPTLSTLEFSAGDLLKSIKVTPSDDQEQKIDILEEVFDNSDGKITSEPFVDDLTEDAIPDEAKQVEQPQVDPPVEGERREETDSQATPLPSLPGQATVGTEKKRYAQDELIRKLKADKKQGNAI